MGLDKQIFIDLMSTEHYEAQFRKDWNPVGSAGAKTPIQKDQFGNSGHLFSIIMTKTSQRVLPEEPVGVEMQTQQ